MFSYQDYLDAFRANAARAGDAFGSGPGPQQMSEADWNAIPTSDRGMTIDFLTTGQPNHQITDPQTIARFQSQVGGNLNGNLIGSYADPTGLNANLSRFGFNGDPRADPNRNIFDPQSNQYLIESNNLSPQYLQARERQRQAANAGDARFAAMGIGSVLGAGLLGNALLAGQSGGLGALDGLDLSPMEHIPETQLNAMGPDFSFGGAAGGLDLSPMQHLPETQLNSMGPDFSFGGAPVTDLSLNRAPVTDLSANQGLGDRAMGLLSGAGMNPTTLSGLLRIAGLGVSASGLFGNHGGGGNTNTNGGGDGGGDKGGGGQGLNITRGTFTPNPITQQQLQNFHYAQPRGR